MGTTGTIKIYEDKKMVLSLYKQYDSFPSVLGQKLKNFFHKGVFVNGIKVEKEQLQFNGVKDFVLLLVKEFKEGTGDLYITNEKEKQEFNYIIEFNHNKNNLNKMDYVIKCLERNNFNERGKINFL